MTLNLRFPPTAPLLATMRAQVVAASQVLWDASEGQLRFGNVTITCGSVNEDLADMWVFAQPGRAGVTFWNDGSGLGRPGIHVNQFLPSSDGVVLAHEFGHLALGLADEYSEQNRFGACWGHGPCMDGGMTERNHCLMQQPGGFSQTELCTDAFHDPLVGDGIPCLTRPVPIGCTGMGCCTVNCEFFNATTGLYETTQQTSMSGRSCWSHVVANFNFLVEPPGLPQAAPNAGFNNPNFIENCAAADSVMLILDRSGSMAWNTELDNGEVCGDGLDNDRDGTIDETADCTGPRIDFMKAAARAYLAVAVDQGARVGIVSFNHTPSIHPIAGSAFQPLTAANLPALNGIVDGLAAGGNTGIGTAMDYASGFFDLEPAPRSKLAFLISDGINTDGVSPIDAANRLRGRNTRVFTISTGGASHDGTLNSIAGATQGSSLDSPNANTLVNAFIRQWARSQNISTLIPQLPYAVNRKNQSVDDSRRTPELWATGRIPQAPPIDQAPRGQFFSVDVEPGTEKVSLVMAGNMREMAGFGMKVTLFGPGGANPSTFDSEVPHALLRVIRDSFFTLVEMKAPNPGTWNLRLEAAPGAADVQQGNITIISDNPQVDLFTSLSHNVVTDAARPLELFVTPIYYTTLFNLDVLTATLVHPDGAVVPLALTFREGGQGDYKATITDTPIAGFHEVRVYMKTGPEVFNDPGEPIWKTAPENSVEIPELVRTATEVFFVNCPRVTAVLSGNDVMVSWRSAVSGFLLQSADSLSGPWSDISSGTPSGVDTYTVKIPLTGSHRFFRLLCLPDACLDLQTMDVQTLPNPWSKQGFELQAFEASGASAEQARIVRLGDFVGMDVRFQSRITLPRPCPVVDLTYAAFGGQSLRIIGFNAEGKEVASSSGSGQSGTATTVTLDGKGELIASVSLTAPNSETVLLKVCCR